MKYWQGRNYILNCQGCHLPDGSGSEGSVPKMNDFVGYFLHVPGGREFLVRVPGAAGAPISDQELADVMNWILLNFSKNELPDPFVPYNAEEIGELRKQPLIEMHQHREELLTPNQGQTWDYGALTRLPGNIDRFRSAARSFNGRGRT